MAKSVFNIAAYCRRMEALVGGEDGKAALFWKAFSFSVNAHQDQRRKSGEIYVSHPCMVAQILVEELGVEDPETLAAAVLHDTVEDVPEVTSEVIGEVFGKNVEAIVDGLTKITNFSGHRQEFYNIVHRKIFSGAASRIGIILIKLADRLHNLRTMESMPKHKRQKISEETMKVYAPMAKVLGLFNVKRELYSLALTYKFPRQSNRVMAYIQKAGKDEQVLAIKQRLDAAMEQSWITCEITIRAKGLYAYYDAVQDILTREIEKPVQIVIVVNDIQSCYRALGVLNQNFPPIPRTIRDYIANPKPTGYQSLHAKANIAGKNFLFKIRTEKMLKDSRTGIVKDWLAKGKVPSGFEKEIREMFKILGSDNDLSYQDVIAASGKKEIYTYTPRGDRIILPFQSVVLDFAFKVHTEIGKRCIGGKIGQKVLKPDHVLYDGNQVEILRQEDVVRFEPKMQQICQSPRARAELARLIRIRRQTMASAIGRSIIEQEMKHYGIPCELFDDEKCAELLAVLDQPGVEVVCRLVGEGRIRLHDLIQEMKRTIFASKSTLLPPAGALNRIHLTTLDPAFIKLSRCCSPLPMVKGLLGLMSERGLSIHRKECRRLGSLEFQREDVVDVRWDLKKTRVRKSQSIHIVSPSPRNRVMMMLSVAPDNMKIIEVISLARVPAKESPWEINFQVDTMEELKNCLHHFDKTGLEYEFLLDQA